MKKIFLFLVLILFVSGCASNEVKYATDVNNFESVVLKNGFSISKKDDAYYGIDYIIDHTMVTRDDIIIEMIVYSDNENADSVQKKHIENFDLLKSTGAQAVKEKGKNYYHYSLISNGRYMLSTRVDNTLIFCKVLLKDKKIIDSIIQEIGY